MQQWLMENEWLLYKYFLSTKRLCKKSATFRSVLTKSTLARLEQATVENPVIINYQ